MRTNRHEHLENTFRSIRTASSGTASCLAVVVMASLFVAVSQSGSSAVENNVILAQTVPLRGLQDDAPSRLPSAPDILRRQQDKQIKSLSGRTSIEESERRQHLERMHDSATDCPDPNNPACKPPPAAK